ncbi:hypothetical protein L1987_23203 [Smallanthus sonchifolius]|uniref:Uncharacterized protein n=1 Tax=Smallanthus sonchifolius TaxID=185202 RepID=A0ACB9IGS9_9ASTR|nr:hypothetical protein L1987_23203 [Smallanthus sonchifolius]
MESPETMEGEVMTADGWQWVFNNKHMARFNRNVIKIPPLPSKQSEDRKRAKKDVTLEDLKVVIVGPMIVFLRTESICDRFSCREQREEKKEFMVEEGVVWREVEIAQRDVTSFPGESCYRGFMGVEVKYMGGQWVLLEFTSIESVQRFEASYEVKYLVHVHEVSHRVHVLFKEEEEEVGSVDEIVSLDGEEELVGVGFEGRGIGRCRF